MLRLMRRKGSGYYYLRGTVRGISVYESTGIPYSHRKAADEVRARREAELLEESIHGKRAVATFADAAKSYVERQGETRFLDPIVGYFGRTKLILIGQSEIDTCARTLLPTQAHDTRNRHVYTPISAVLKHAAKRGWCNEFSIQRPKTAQGRVRWITKIEAERLIESCADHFRPLVMFLLYTGARCGEALWLDWRQVDLERKHVEFLDTKNGASRGVPLHTRLAAELGKKSNREGPVFFNRLGKPYAPLDQENEKDTSAGNRIRKAFAAACRRARIEDFTPHDCRHTWATWHYQANRDLGALQRLGGWKTLSMVMRYAHTNVAELSETIERL